MFIPMENFLIGLSTICIFFFWEISIQIILSILSWLFKCFFFLVKKIISFLQFDLYSCFVYHLESPQLDITLLVHPAFKFVPSSSEILFRKWLPKSTPDLFLLWSLIVVWEFCIWHFSLCIILGWFLWSVRESSSLSWGHIIALTEETFLSNIFLGTDV